MHVMSGFMFMLAILLLSQRQQASGPVLAAASPLLIVQQVEEAVQLQVAFELILAKLIVMSCQLLTTTDSDTPDTSSKKLCTRGQGSPCAWL